MVKTKLNEGWNIQISLGRRNKMKNIIQVKRRWTESRNRNQKKC